MRRFAPFRILHSAFYIPHSAFRILHSTFYILQDPKPLHIFLNCTNPANAEVFDQDFGHIW